MGVDVLKKLKKDAKTRQKQASQPPRESRAQAKAKPEPAHRFFVSSNWKSLIERKPDIAPKASSAAIPATTRQEAAGSNVVAIDCEMVGVGPDGARSVLARVSIVDSEGKVLMDRFVRPKEFVTDFRTHITGITPGTFKKPDIISEDVARQMAAKLLDGKIVVGHSVQNDFQALLLSHPHVLIRDTALFRPLRPQGQKRTPSLRKLAEHWLKETIQEGQHDSVEDARVALRLYRMKCKEWEKQLRSAMQHHRSGGAAASPPVGMSVDEEEQEDAGESVDRALASQKTRKKTAKKNTQRDAQQDDMTSTVAPDGEKSKVRKGKKGKVRKKPTT
eukprot:TRINITY_DN61163_c0_g1_i1.p1 TRINITY_DN61163_c0_g1~~TRINITY_DN61163_c0_g1_i1.p1  ORF type:complete len:344 (+),score=57.65 TRINITY_DN61163_c0_g1_i1:39-1034(+)